MGGAKSRLEESFFNTISLMCRSAGVEVPNREYRFHPKRRWRFDFAWPEDRIVVEIEGGTWNGGRHTTGAGFSKDCEKYNTAVLEGWRVFRLTSDMLKKSEVEFCETIIKLLHKEGEKNEKQNRTTDK